MASAAEVLVADGCAVRLRSCLLYFPKHVDAARYTLRLLERRTNVTTYGEASSSRRDGASSVLPAWTRQGLRSPYDAQVHLASLGYRLPLRRDDATSTILA